MGRKITLALGILTALALAVPAIATTPDDLDQHVSIVDCTGTVTRSGRTLEVWVPDLDGEKVTTLESPGDTWTVNGPATFTVVLRTEKQVNYKTYTVPGGCDEPTTTTTPPTTTTAPCNPNSAPCWCDDGVKIEPGGMEWVADADYDLVVVKGGSVDYGDGPGNLVYYNVQAGDVLVAPLNAGGQQAAISHIILCGKQEVPPSTTTTVLDTTTTTMVTTTTVSPPSSTTEAPPPTTIDTSSTTTTLPVVTSSTVPETSVTSTTTPPTVPSSSLVPPTTTTSKDCDDNYAVNDKGECILVVTGSGLPDWVFGAGLLMLFAGVALVGGTLLPSRAGKE